MIFFFIQQVTHQWGVTQWWELIINDPIVQGPDSEYPYPLFELNIYLILFSHCQILTSIGAVG